MLWDWFIVGSCGSFPCEDAALIRKDHLQNRQDVTEVSPAQPEIWRGRPLTCGKLTGRVFLQITEVGREWIDYVDSVPDLEGVIGMRGISF
jgi:hypothetical protein